MGSDKKEDTKKPHPMTDPNLCKDLKERHDACFNKWYTNAFLKGTSTTSECQDEWEEYQVCLKDKLKQWNLEYLMDKNKVADKHPTSK
ncbi:hypothetical protein CYY_000364 [Polysphondylium violaceum]|uniref:Uncharacterized protein n=1 Tax=Polysphondylium violaceum TaxID=133409 RepID=A0A8J4Q216_9MYCE|nr:hypothetical protein CYY_000364 [Polysphondylium violaceum]